MSWEWIVRGRGGCKLLYHGVSTKNENITIIWHDCVDVTFLIEVSQFRFRFSSRLDYVYDLAVQTNHSAYLSPFYSERIKEFLEVLRKCMRAWLSQPASPLQSWSVWYPYPSIQREHTLTLGRSLPSKTNNGKIGNFAGGGEDWGVKNLNTMIVVATHIRKSIERRESEAPSFPRPC